MLDAFLSGAIGAATAALGKVAFDSDSPLQHNINSYCSPPSPSSIPSPPYFLCHHRVKVTRIVGLIVMLSFNGFALKKFVDGMKVNGSASGVALSSASNYVFASLLGWMFLGEVRAGAKRQQKQYAICRSATASTITNSPPPLASLLTLSFPEQEPHMVQWSAPDNGRDVFTRYRIYSKQEFTKEVTPSKKKVNMTPHPACCHCPSKNHPNFILYHRNPPT